MDGNLKCLTLCYAICLQSNSYSNCLQVFREDTDLLGNTCIVVKVVKYETELIYRVEPRKMGITNVLLLNYI